MRPDGTRVKNASAIVSALPYIMPRRYDAHDYITEYAEMEPLRRYIQSKRREGVRISYMALILAAYFKAYQQNPKINRFIMNSKIYQRNHFCVSFVILKTRADGTPDETSVKIFFEDGDDVISINRKIEDAVALNQKKEHNNNTDRFANFMFSLPVLPTLLVGLVKLLDRLGLLPRFVIDLSPFHTSLFITNLASINTEAIYHHCYEFGTTGVFVCMGKPVPNFLTGEYNKKIMPLGIVMDERICTGHEYALFWQTLRRYLKHPELTENGAETIHYFSNKISTEIRRDIDDFLKEKKGMSQDELAEKLFVTRQAVSRWENGETVPNTETLKLLSRLFNVSINTLLGSPRQLICQCCGMPLEEASLSRELDGAINEDYCKWCYANGKFAYTSMDKLIDFCAEHMASEQWPAGQVRAYMAGLLPTLKHWQAAE